MSPRETTEKIREALASGRVIDAIKLHRAAFGTGLAEAKAAVEGLGDPAVTLDESGRVVSDLETAAGRERQERAAAQAAAIVPRVSQLLREGDYIGAVAYTRDQTGLHLRECRAIVERVAESQGQKVPKAGCAGLAAVLFAIGGGVASAVWSLIG